MSLAERKRTILASRMRTQGLAFNTKVPGLQKADSGAESKSTSQAQGEGDSEVSGAQVHKGKARGREDAEEVDVGAKVADIASEGLQKKKKKRKVGISGQDAAAGARVEDNASGVPGPVEQAPDTGMVSETPLRKGAPETSKIVTVAAPVVEVGSPAGDGAPGTVATARGVSSPGASSPTEKKVGSKTLGELAGMAASIADDKEWERLKDSTLVDSYRGRLALWAQDAMLIAKDRRLIASYRKEMRELSEQITQRDNLIATLQEEAKERERGILVRSKATGLLKAAHDKLKADHDKLQDTVDELGAQLHTTGENLKHAEFRENELKVRAEEAEKKLEGRNGRVAELEAELNARRPEKEVIQAYLDSDEYTGAVMDEVAQELARCWKVTKELTQAKPDHSYDEFYEAFFAEDGETKEQEAVPPGSPVPNPPEDQVEYPAEPVSGQVADGAGVPEIENPEKNQETPDGEQS